MFIGQFTHNLDDKKRVIVPTKFREELGKQPVMTVGNDGCISLYTESSWAELQDKLLALNTNSDLARKRIRFIAGNASCCTIDSQGRAMLTPNLIKYANIQKEVVVIGNIDHVEIWAKENWENYFKEVEDSFDEITESLI